MFSSKGAVKGRFESERKNPADVGGVILFYGDPGRWLTNITNLSGHCDFVVDGSAVGAKITATKHNFVPGQKTVTGS